MKAVYRQTRFNVGENTWPPEQPKDFTPVVLVHYEEQRSTEDIATIMKTLHIGGISDVIFAANNQPIPIPQQLNNHQQLREALQTSKVTRNIADVLMPFEQCENPQIVLVEGAPGIGKSMLMKHIAYKWAEGEVLLKYQLVMLVSLRDPGVQKLSSVGELLYSFCKCNTDALDLAACNKMLFQNNGKSIVFLLDGFDEFPVELRQNSLIASIINRQVLPECSVMVSSRPHASLCLHNKASLRVDILGFTEDEREHFIAQSLKKQPQKISELVNYLQHNISISSLCFTPFNMTVLLFLYKQGVPLPNNSTELYKLFICLTICRHLAKNGKKIMAHCITDLQNLPDPCGKIIEQLSMLSLQALNNNQLIFTSEQVNTCCPHLEDVPGAINGFGLLQVVEHYGIFSTTKTFNFIHFSIQEYLAAHCIAHLLPPDKEYSMLRQYFLTDTQSNMFNIYVSLTKGQKPSFKRFLCGGNNLTPIEDKFLNSTLKRLYLYRCFHEAGDEEMCSIIEQKTSGRIISLMCCTLSPNDLQNVTIMLTKSSIKHWKGLFLLDCHIQDYGMQLLHQGLHNSGVTIEHLLLDNNYLSSSSDSILSDIIYSCKVQSLGIDNNNAVGETEQFITTVLSHPSSRLKRLYMNRNKYSSTKWAIQLFTSMMYNKSLEVLEVAGTSISDDVCNVIVKALQVNDSLRELSLESNWITGEASILLVESLQNNNALNLLKLPKYSDNINKAIISLQEAVNKQRTSRKCNVKLEINLSVLVGHNNLCNVM